MQESTYLPPGSVLADRYEIAEELGRGGFSVVYRARDRRVGTDVAIKLLVPPPASARLARERLRREVQAVRQLQHANIVAVYDFAESGPWSFVVMALIAGPDLAVRVQARGSLEAEATAQVGRDIAGALDAAHSRGILHRDVKPQNILLDPGGRALLTDFGSARLAGQVTLTQTGGMVGTLAFAAPEVLAGGQGDGRADVYALGLTLYYTLAGEMPFRASTNRTPAADGYSVRERRPEVPGWLDAAIMRATAADAADRFPSAALLALALSPDAEGAAGTCSPVSMARDRCALCHAADPFGLGVCSRCARRASGTGDVLVFLDRTSPGSPRGIVSDALERRLGAWTGRAMRDAVLRGERPLLRVPAAAGPRVIDLLEAQGLPGHTEVVRPAWRSSAPLPIAVLGATVAVLGVVTGFAAGVPLLLLTSPAVAAGLVAAATFGRRSPVWNPPPAGSSRLEPSTATEAARALAELPRGQARSLLADVVRRAGAVTDGKGDVGALVVAACGVARDLAALEQHLDAFDAAGERLTEPNAKWLDALTRCEKGRDVLTQRMLETSAALSGWQAATRTTGVAGDLADLVRALNEETHIQAEAAREVAELLA